MGIFNSKKKDIKEISYQEYLESQRKNISNIKIRTRVDNVIDGFKSGVITYKDISEEDGNHILDYYINGEHDFDSIEDFSRYLKNIYDIILPYGKDTNGYDRLINLFTSLFDKDGLIANKMFRMELFNLFQDKRYFLLLSRQSLNYPEISNNFDLVVSYACSNRQYFVNEDNFYNHMLGIMKKLREWVLAGENYKENLLNMTSENKRMIGIYDISEASLEELDDLINSADGLLVKLTEQCDIGDQKLTELREELESIKEKLKNITKFEEQRLNKKKEELIEQFKTELARIIVEEERKLQSRSDGLISEIGAKIQDRISDLRIVIDSADEITRGQLERIRQAGEFSTTRVEKVIGELNSAMKSAGSVTQGEIERIKLAGEATSKQVQQIVGENPELQSALESYMPIPEVMAKLSEIQQIIRVGNPQQTIITSSPTIIIPDEVPEDINHFFDTRIPFESRIREIEDKMQENIKHGEIYHEKFLTLVKMIIEDCNPYLWGNSGLGKTYMIEQAFNLLGLPYRPINKILEDYDIIGAMLPNGAYSSPLWYQCYKYGYGAFLDELDSSNSEATIVINSFTSNKKGSFYPFPNQEVVYRHPNFRIVAAGNTAATGADNYFVDRKQLDESVQQRLMPLYLTPDSRIERKILHDYPDWFEFVQNFRRATEKYAESREDKVAPGEITTRDTEKIKQMKDNNSFTDEEIIEYEFIENKGDDYLGVLQSYLEDIYDQSSSDKSRKLYKKFSKRVSEIRGGGN